MTGSGFFMSTNTGRYGKRSGQAARADEAPAEISRNICAGGRKWYALQIVRPIERESGFAEQSCSTPRASRAEHSIATRLGAG